MYPNPVSIGSDMPVSEALKIMRDGKFRHLPVLKDGTPYSIVTEKEIAMVLALSEDSEKLLLRPVSDFCALELVSVDMNTNLVELLDDFINTKIGAVVVLEEQEFVGIISVIDVLKAFRGMLSTDT